MIDLIAHKQNEEIKERLKRVEDKLDEIDKTLVKLHKEIMFKINTLILLGEPTPKKKGK